MKIDFYIEKDLKKCEELWQNFYPNKFLVDLWDFRLCFHQAYGEEPYFIVGKLQDEVIGFLPLEFCSVAGNVHVFFGGGDWLEHFTFYIKEEYKKEALPLFFKQLPASALWFIDKSEVPYFKKGVLEEDDNTYFLNLEKYHYNIDEYFADFSKESRHSTLRSFRKIEELPLEIKINHWQDYEKLVEYNKSRFGKESSFHDKGFFSVFKLMMENPILRDKLRMVSVYINGEVKACVVNIIMNEDCTVMQAGNDPDIPNIYKYLMYQVILDGISQKLKILNFGSDECGWKERWRLEKEQLFSYEN